MTELQVLKDNIKVLLKLEYGTDINIESDWDLLWYLCENNKVELIKDLINNGFDINIKNDEGDTLLMSASFMVKPLVLKTLLEVKASPNIVDKFNNTVLYYARYYGSKEIVKLLEKYNKIYKD